MKCPHCLVEFHDNVEKIEIGKDIEGNYEIKRRTCPSCRKVIFHLTQYKNEFKITDGPAKVVRIDIAERLIRPKIANRPPCPAEVPEKFASDYIEACLVLDDSPKASAALSRRCLQNIIHDHLGIIKRDLNLEIQEVIDKKLFPSDILDSIDAIRNIGNFAAHPIKSTSSGEIVEVEPNEADWNLDVLEMMFDYLFVRPALVQKKREALNAKLKDAGKPEMK
ncbi:MAG: DUF4145 domain-containing protein [Ignavibacterium album]|uniref:DUF4145 domain-containing protein n=1 Tax=Ignavibacterium album TaxID=591197 RepID=UPI0026EE3D26|nr:DUF4145 domain-containing protein [Ignavibacterium album]MCX8105287.1 DUF4145 domain-containing protein [Ignavibacterium album]